MLTGSAIAQAAARDLQMCTLYTVTYLELKREVCLNRLVFADERWGCYSWACGTVSCTQPQQESAALGHEVCLDGKKKVKWVQQWHYSTCKQ